ncbi:unnamed protein product [Eruca vesicaria subsp. sativa]|uniref:Reverse transcriptase n=1 Tax=Eruca vesicaria subsp. sativa TaxID=29727 RepID=A0ABC8L6Q3_ERUVS|nr:unnamed protein product [Eruca vesicaria subsp. sativa]
MANLKLASLPSSMLHKIIFIVARSSVWEVSCAQVAFPGFSVGGREDYFYKSANLIFMKDWIDVVNAVIQRSSTGEICMSSSSSIYLIKEKKKIHLASKRGFLLVRYVDDMMNLAFCADDRGLVHKYPAFTLEYVDWLYHMITSWVLSGHWGYDKPKMFMSLLQRIDPNVSNDCSCSRIIEPVFVISLDG